MIEKDTNKVDFFYKTEVQGKFNGKFIAYLLQPKNIQNFFTFIKSMIPWTIIFFILYLIIHACTVHGNRVDKENELYKTTNVKMVNSVSQDKFNNIISFIKQNNIKESDRLNDVYWKVKFLDSLTDNSVDMKNTIKSYYNKTNDLHKEINTNYNHDIESIISFYSRMKESDFKTEIITYNNTDPAFLFHKWNDAQTQNNMFNYKNIDELDQATDNYIINKVDYANFIEKNKDNIEKTKKIFEKQ